MEFVVLRLHALGEIDNAADFLDRGRAVEYPAQAVVSQGTKSLGQCLISNFTERCPATDQVIKVVIQAQQFHDRDAAAIALIFAMVATGGTVDDRCRLPAGDADQLAFLRLGRVGLAAMRA